LGILKAGAAYVPIDPDYPAERRAFMLHDSGARYVLADEALRADLDLAGDRVLSLEHVRGAGIGVRAFRAQSAPEAAAYVIYTSGSTGRPKGAPNAHRAICNRIAWMQDRYRLGAADVVLQKTPISFDVSVWEFFWPLVSGARLVMARPGGHRDNAYLIRTIVAHEVSVVHFVPSMLRAFLGETAVARCTSLRDVMCSGEALPADLVTAFYERLPANLHNLYGPTEAAVDVTHWSAPRGWSEPLVPIGRPVANTRLYVLDEGGSPVPVGVPGELYIGGVQVGLGYHRRPELTADKFVPDPFGEDPAGRLYRTGDLVRYRADGNLDFLGRLDYQVKLRGFRIELGEIENVLMQHSAVRDAVTVLREDAPGGPALVAYYVAADSSPVSAAFESELRVALQAALPEYMVPAWYVSLPALPLSENGKLDRRALPAPAYTLLRESSKELVAPRNATEDVLASMTAEILGSATVGVEDDFFALGGHSLGAMRLVARVAKSFRTELSVRSFFEAPSVAGLANALFVNETSPGRTEALARAIKALAKMTPEERTS
ncbi:MAG: amino acid adenylation domain-containing protein, partial [Candidatus Eremiobacteraeota bacterium]|nr:amino acid adenylation domain-containing protein [Candidatus Eremiobacteraeota bacterium]